MKDVFEKLRQAMLDAVTDKSFLQSIGEWTKDRIVKRTRLGSGVDSRGAPASKLKPLSERYKEKRKELRKTGVLSDLTRPSTSNLTKTGKMLDSLTVKAGDGRVEVSVTSDQEQKVKANTELGRTFLNVSDKDLKELKTMLIQRIAKAIKK